MSNALTIPDEFRLGAVKHPKWIAGAVAALAGIEFAAFWMVMARAASDMGLLVFVGLLASLWTLGAATSFVIMAFVLGVRTRTAFLRVAVWIMGLTVAGIVGMASTLFIYGGASPFGFVLEGITGPLTDGVLGSIFRPATWPVTFTAAPLLAIWSLLHLLPGKERSTFIKFCLFQTAGWQSDDG